MRFQDQNVLITGAARSQGRSHAIAFAREGANVIAIDTPQASSVTPYALPEDGAELAETQRLIEAEGRRCVALDADVRDRDAVADACERAVSELGPLDVVVANAGIFVATPIDRMSVEEWTEVIDTNLTGVFNTVHATLPSLSKDGGRPGRIVAIGSMAGRLGFAPASAYTASKWGVIGLVKELAIELAPYGVTVNAICPTTVETPMVHNPAAYALFARKPDPAQDEVLRGAIRMHPLGIPWIETQDVSNALLFIASEDARYITGEALTVSAGMMAMNAA